MNVLTMDDKEKERDYLYIVKGVAIFLVVFGHCIQHGSGLKFEESASFYDDVLFKIIYSFHMPLFMLISGYLFYYTINKYTFNQLVVNRIIKLLIPIGAWTVIYNCIARYGMDDNFATAIREVFYFRTTAAWFLRVIFWNSLLVIIINRFFKDNIYLYLLGGGDKLYIPRRIYISVMCIYVSIFCWRLFD